MQKVKNHSRKFTYSNCSLSARKNNQILENKEAPATLQRSLWHWWSHSRASFRQCCLASTRDASFQHWSKKIWFWMLFGCPCPLFIPNMNTSVHHTKNSWFSGPNSTCLESLLFCCACGCSIADFAGGTWIQIQRCNSDFNTFACICLHQTWNYFLCLMISL